MWYKNIAGRFFGLVTKHACDGQTDGRTDGQNYDSQDRASTAASRGKNASPYAIGPLSCLPCLSVCDVGVLWPSGWMDQDKIWHAGRRQPWPHCVRWGPSSPPL